MADTKYTVIRLNLDGNKFELLVKPDPALEYKLGKRTDLSSVLISDEIYSDANKGSRVGVEKLVKYFNTTDPTEISKQILSRGELSLTTEQRRKMVEEKRKQIIQYINKNFVDPKTHIPHPLTRIESALDQARLIIDPFKRPEEQIKTILDSLRKILPLKSESVRLTITIPPQFSAQSYSVLKTAGNFNGEQWLSDGSLKVIIEINAGMKGVILDRIGSVTKGSAHVTEG
ncbi:MAG: ribosome assembly factor SBDS [Thermoproteota archaeon]|jgi:ribosome maturation protein SDO1|nr:ribosome assembly factor SBDS [Thermoproteota archaeon]HYY50731.1 ribosome assembly factor SBDS [Nitrososphaeraceae archaeon]